MAKAALDWVHPISNHIDMLLIFDKEVVVTILDKNQLDTFLDGDLSLSNLQGQYKAVYVQANFDWLIQALVCFHLSLDGDGYCEENFLMPLQRMCDTAGPGPDFGAGRIRLACRSQCPVSGFKTKLWDPSTVTFAAIQGALEASQGEWLHNVTDLPYEEEDVVSVKRTLRNEEAANRNQVQQLQQEIEQQKLLVERLQAELLELRNKKSSLNEHELRRENDQLNMKLREQQVIIEKLRSVPNMQANHDVDSEMISKMEANEVMSVAFHPGVGHINLQASQLMDYLEDPVAYAAHMVSLSKSQYKVWLKHHDHPNCQVCNDEVPLIGNPKIFDAQLDVYCDQHKPLE